MCRKNHPIIPYDELLKCYLETYRCYQPIKHLADNLMRKILFIIMLFCQFGVHAYSGLDLLEQCSENLSGEEQNDARDVDPCRMYIQGIVDGHETYVAWAQMSATYCIPSGTDSDDLRQVFLLWIEERPDTWTYKAASLVTMSLKEIFPCE